MWPGLLRVLLRAVLRALQSPPHPPCQTRRSTHHAQCTVLRAPRSTPRSNPGVPHSMIRDRLTDRLLGVRPNSRRKLAPSTTTTSIFRRRRRKGAGEALRAAADRRGPGRPDVRHHPWRQRRGRSKESATSARCTGPLLQLPSAATPELPVLLCCRMHCLHSQPGSLTTPTASPRPASAPWAQNTAPLSPGPRIIAWECRASGTVTWGPLGRPSSPKSDIGVQGPLGTPIEWWWFASAASASAVFL